MADEPAKIILGDTAISAVERTARRRWFGRGKDRQPLPFTHCENCGAELAGPHCAQCGQAAIDYRRSFRQVIVDVLDSFLNWDSKFFATIGLLIVKPWRLTNEFLAGRRVRYLHPLRLYLLASILFFFAVNYYGANGLRVEPGKISPKDRDAVAAEIKKKRSEIETELQQENLSPENRRKAQEVLDALSNPTPAPTGTASTQEGSSPSPVDQNNQGDFGPVLQMDHKPSTPFEKWIENQAKEKMGEHGTKMGLFITTLLNNLPYMMLCCIPLFALVLKVLYVRRHIFYIDHLIYALHIHTFSYTSVMLIVLATIGLNRTIPGTFAGWVIGLLWITFVVQIFLSIRRVYRQGWFISILKFFTGGLIYLMVLSVALAATFFITLALP